MTKDPIHEMLENPALVAEQLPELEKWMKRFPYVSIFQTLKTKALRETDSLEYDEELKKAAIMAPNRELLYYFLMQPEIEKQIEEIENSVLEEEAAQSEVSLNENPVNEPEIERPISLTVEEEKPTLESKPTTTEYEQLEEYKTLQRQMLAQAVSASILQEPLMDDSEIEADEEIEVQPLKMTTFSDDTGLLDWLKATGELTDEPLTLPSSNSLIENFIKKDPQKITIEREEAPHMVQINRPKQEFFTPENMAKMSVSENENLITETLARIYVQQGHFKKAIKGYEILQLKFPEKRDYFAALIKELKNKH